MTSASAARPKESEFYAPLLYLLGKMTGFKPYVAVNHKAIQDDVLRLAGYKILLDENGEAERAADTHGNTWPLRSEGSSDRNGLYRVVHFAWYHQTQQYRSRTPGRTYCGKVVNLQWDRLRMERNKLLGLTDDECEILRGRKASAKRKIQRKMEDARAKLSTAKRIRVDVVVAEMKRLQQLTRGQWCLTAEGAKKARELASRYEGKILLSEPNVTAKYLGANYDRLYDRITLHLRRKMPRSEMLGQIEDHAGNWITRVIARDGLRSRIEAGRGVAPSQVAAWARRSAYTDIRNAGREPVCRVFHGALTKPEIAAYDPSNWTTQVIPRTINESELLQVNTYAEHSEDDQATDPIENLVDDHPLSSVESAVLNSDTFDLLLSRVSEILYDELDEKHDAAFHTQLAHDRFVKEMTLQEIVEAHGLADDEEDRVHAALTRVRVLMLRAREDGKFDDFLIP